jgi:hypothetical protein
MAASAYGQLEIWYRYCKPKNKGGVSNFLFIFLDISLTPWCCFKTSVEGPFANAPVDNRSVSQHVCSAEWLLSGEPFKESIFFWSRFQRLSCPFSVRSPVPLQNSSLAGVSNQYLHVQYR